MDEASICYALIETYICEKWGLEAEARDSLETRKKRNNKNHYQVKAKNLLVSWSLEPGLETRKYGRRDPSRWPRGTFYPQKLALTSLTSGCRLVGIVRSRTKATECVCVCVCVCVCEIFEVGLSCLIVVTSEIVQ
jgi:hypothetical protein